MIEAEHHHHVIVIVEKVEIVKVKKIKKNIGKIIIKIMKYRHINKDRIFDSDFFVMRFRRKL